jgi:hypothetical protein
MSKFLHIFSNNCYFGGFACFVLVVTILMGEVTALCSSSLHFFNDQWCCGSFICICYMSCLFFSWINLAKVYYFGLFNELIFTLWSFKFFLLVYFINFCFVLFISSFGGSFTLFLLFCVSSQVNFGLSICHLLSSLTYGIVAMNQLP